MLKFFLLIAFPLNNGFLLDTGSIHNTRGSTPRYNQYLTVSELYDTKTELQNSIDQVGRETKSLRHDVDNKLNMFTSQVQQILASFKLEADKMKNTTDLHSEYNELMHNHTKLQYEFTKLKNENANQQQMILVNQNNTIELAKQIVELKSLRNIQQLGDLHGIQQEIQQLHSQTQSLSVNERARSQDFQALYNMTLHTETNIKNVTAYLSKREKDSNMTLLSLMKNMTDSISSLKRTVSDSNEKVAMTACKASSDYGSRPDGYIVKFADVSESYNIKNLSAIANIGKFEVEVDGMYLVSAWIFSKITSRFSIRKNGMQIAVAYMSGSSAGSNVVATAIVALDLKRLDKIWVQMESAFFIHSDERTSCFTLIKVH